MEEEEDVLETIRKTVEGSKKTLERGKVGIDWLEAMEIDVKEVRKSYDEAKKTVDKMEAAYTLVKSRK